VANRNDKKAAAQPVVSMRAGRLLLERSAVFAVAMSLKTLRELCHQPEMRTARWTRDLRVPFRRPVKVRDILVRDWILWAVFTRNVNETRSAFPRLPVFIVPDMVNENRYV